MVVKTTAIYIPLRTVLEKQYFVIRVEETKRPRVKKSKSFGVGNLLSLSLTLSLSLIRLLNESSSLLIAFPLWSPRKSRIFGERPPGPPESFARMGRGGAMERFISACRNLLAKSATTKAIGYATQVPNASAKLLLFSDMAMACSLTCRLLSPDL